MSLKNLDYTCAKIIEEYNLISKIEYFESDKNNYKISFEFEKYDKKKFIVV